MNDDPLKAIRDGMKAFTESMAEFGRLACEAMRPVVVALSESLNELPPTARKELQRLAEREGKE